jgi:hypothetical protein
LSYLPTPILKYPVQVAELVLCCKEANTKTRAAGYALLVQVSIVQTFLSGGPSGQLAACQK